ncbi:hypothetical protein [Streptomyces chilikensis]|uniref:hypothetical protein n=1 Tax=Streptomyces chilikensis TaxID=1194079 RepID=UPI000AA771C9|nr:hypothetical protein [Streptomyces chilikensis]
MQKLLTRAAVSAAAVLLTTIATGCDDDGRADEAQPSKATACETLIGREGIAWAETAAASRTEESTRTALDVAKAEAWFQSSAYAWNPSRTEKPHPSIDPALCKIVPEGVGEASRSMEISYGGSVARFDELEPKELGDEVRVIPVNSDVRLVIWGGVKETRLRSVHVRCKVPLTEEGQEDGMPLQGRMRDSLTTDRDDKNRLTYLLRSAHVIVEAFDCENRPTVPTELPSDWQSG